MITYIYNDLTTIDTRMNNTILGTSVSLTTNWYTFPCDGYVVLNMLNSSGDKIYVLITGSSGENFPIGDHNSANYPGVALFVRKGLRAKVTIKEGNTGTAVFYPLI